MYGVRTYHPGVAGFTCDAASSPEWVDAVSRVWIAYYEGVGKVGGVGDRVRRRGGVRVSKSIGFVDGVGPVRQRGCGKLLGVDEVVESLEEVGDCYGSVRVDGPRGSVGDSVDESSGSEVVIDGGINGLVTVSALKGPNGGLSVGRGPNYERNKKAREARRSSKKEGHGSELQASLEAKWKVENELAVARAQRQLELLRARDLEAEKKMQRVQILRTTEAAKVQTERAYATLKRTGNVPGFAETVVTDGSCPVLSPSRSDGTCISPDSSVSQQEIRAMMKELEDLKLMQSRMRRDNPAFVEHHEQGLGVKTAFTLDSEGFPPVEEPGSIGLDGKFHLDEYNPNPRFLKDRLRAEELTGAYFNRE